MRITLLTMVVAGIFLFTGCRSEQPATQSAGPETDSLSVKVKQRIAEKKRLEAIRRELYSGNRGRAIDRYKPIIKKYAKHYGFDWRLIIAQIYQESGFQEKARSRVGARGLMQIMPGTARDISRELDIEYIMKNPRENITAGIYHLKKQLRYFPDANYSDRTRLALASYNAGSGRVFDAQDITQYFKSSPNRWIAVSPNLKKLKKSDWELHLQVWPEGKPRFGYFYGYNETINYVNSIWSLYLAYQQIL